ncbi:MAG: response regulator [Nitrospinota bacterium]
MGDMTEKGHILLVDDDETFLRSTCDLLRARGYDCTGVPDVETAGRWLRESEYDLLIADIKMPGNAELEFIRALPPLAEGMPVILVTGYPSMQSAIQSIQLPVIAYLVKPFESDQLGAHVQRAVERSRMYRAVSQAQRRLQDWSRSLVGIREALREAPQYAPPTSVDSFLNLTFRNIAASLSDVKNLSEALAFDKEIQAPCHLMNCPRHKVLTDALVETIHVLEKTKSAFKSKDLGELRKKLSRVFEEEAGSTPAAHD